MKAKWHAALNRALRAVRYRDGIVGVDYGYAYKDGQRPKTLGIRFHVAQKLPLSEIPPERILPSKLDGYRCDVLEARYSLHGNPKKQCDPMQPGVSIGNVVRRRTGTLGMFVKDQLGGRPGLLSNWHVLCGSLQASAGDTISQPGPHHAGTSPARIIGALERWVPLDTGCDAALALLSDAIETSDLIFDSALKIDGIVAARNGLKLMKYGVTSKLTYGIVDGIDGSYEVDYSGYGDQKRWIDGIRIVVNPEHATNEISLAGDSGAIWVDVETSRAVALHFAGEDGLGPTAEYALAQPIQRVLNLLDLSVP